MKIAGTRRAKLSKRITAAARSERPLRALAKGLRQFAEEAFAEANSISIEHVKIYLDRLPEELDGFRLVHLSDIHHSPFTSIEHISRVVEVSNRLKPDMFMLTGDYVSHEPEYIAPVAEVLSGLQAEHGTHACLGNHDHWTDADLVTRRFRRAGINLLINEGIRYAARGTRFWLCGVDDYMVGKTDLKAALTGSGEDEFQLLLAHNPQIVRPAARYGVDLMLSGHTHGGQVKIRDEEKRILPRRKLTSGLHRRKNTQIYITRGIGTVVVPVRYQCPPEISLIELKASGLGA